MTTQDLQKYRPQLHFAPKANWMNDPNGLVYFKGEYHLFFQYNPNDSVWGPMHWGHAVSKDMITWEELDIALYPDEHGTIFSGSAVVDWNNTTGFFPDEPGLVAIFTHHIHREGEQPSQSQSLAYSHDLGRTWKKYGGNPVLGHESKMDFRDPKVFWHKETARWIMALATGQTISFYSSSNLIDWKFESEFGEGIGSHDGVWECPDLFKLQVEDSEEEKWFLIVSIGDNPAFAEGSRTQYFVGSFNGSNFVAEHDDIKWLDFGRDNYAGVSFSDIPEEDGRRIYLGWMSNWRYANHVPTEGWRSQMTIPRELSLRKTSEGFKVVQKLVKELDAYFSKEKEVNDAVIEGTETFKIEAPYLDLVMNFENVDATKFGMTLEHTADQYTSISFDAEKNLLVLDRKTSGDIDFSEMFSNEQLVKIENTDNVQVRLLLDTSSVELLINDGEYALTSLIYPDKVCEAISLFTSNGSMKVSNSYISIPSK
ncbi:sucrose-6-phosphate hydrolase SacC (GH32 family) [Evansella vedderi]|uniref:Sucrose-6-phosphate hydrolase SacC (GH32 family) n=1 Tax=Evansella vedderi TaxID=38282 RepID=A0ABU0A0Q3_9BACI|nr:glycoside hydrolase family 32 protein [Evansella vedderi]MDQ0257059.1 sucrose-6-phosphate hydrolase SacC (GH32 family) [Evansella vedderi]